MATSKPLRLIIEATAEKIDGPRADPSAYCEDIATELEGMQIEVQDPDRDDPTLVELSISSVTPAG